MGERQTALSRKLLYRETRQSYCFCLAGRANETVHPRGLRTPPLSTSVIRTTELSHTSSSLEQAHSAHTSRGRGTRTEAPKVPRGVDIRGKPGRPEALPTPPCHQAWWSNPEPNSELSVLPRSFWDQADTCPRSVSGEGERLRFYADLEPGGVPDCCDVRWCSTQTFARCHSGRRGVSVAPGNQV